MAEPASSMAAEPVVLRAPRSAGKLLLIVCAAAMSAEAVIFYLAARGAALPPLLAAHLALVAAMIVCLQQSVRTGADGGYAVLAIVATLATGPFGAVGALMMSRLARRNVGNDRLLSAWYERIALSANQDQFTRLSDRVAIGRAANLAAPAPEPFVEMFKTGPIGSQQIALGLIARNFHSGYLPVLKIALDSPEPVIRVQAAAVAARIRGPLNVNAAAQFDRASDPTLPAAEALELAAELRAAINSGLLDAAEQTKAIGVHDALLARTFARLDATQRTVGPGAHARPQKNGDDVDEAYATHLLANGRFAEFRAYRLAVRRPLSGRYRRRRVRSRRVSPRVLRQLRPILVRA